MIHLYLRLYYEFYLWSVRVNGEEYYNRQSASLMLALVVLFNVSTLIVVCSVILGWDIAEIAANKYFVVSMTVSVVFFNIVYLGNDSRHEKIMSMFETSTRDVDVISRSVKGYVVVSVLGLFISWVMVLYNW